MEPKVVVVSRRGVHPHVGWVAIDEFEDLLAQYCGGIIVAPKRRGNSLLARSARRLLSDVVFDDNPPDAEILLVVARSPNDLAALRAVSRWRSRYRRVVGLVIDSYFHAGFPRDTACYDHIFVTTSDAVEIVTRQFSVKCTVLRQGMDCLRWAPPPGARSIDLIGFGRQPPSYHKAFQRAFHDATSPHLYLHSPVGALTGPAIWAERPMLLKLLQRSKLSLAFHLFVEPVGNRPRAMFLTSRWFESLAAGCVVVGKAPPGDMLDEMLPWEDASIELPDDPLDAVEFVRSLLQDENRLELASRRNVAEMCARHDWRYRIRDLFEQLGLPVGEDLRRDLHRVRATAASYAQSREPADSR